MIMIETFLRTRMHSSRMRTAHSLTVSRSICWGACMACTPPVMHAPPATHAPCHACCPAMHTTPSPHMPPSHACPPPPWTDRHLWKHNLRKLRLRAVNILSLIYTVSLHETTLQYTTNGIVKLLTGDKILSDCSKVMFLIMKPFFYYEKGKISKMNQYEMFCVTKRKIEQILKINSY